MHARARAYSAGSPRRDGNGTCLPSESCASCGRPAIIGVSKMPGAIVHDADADAREVARDRQRHADDAALGGRVGGLADLAVEGGDRRGVDDDAALAVGERLEPGHRGRRRAGSC